MNFSLTGGSTYAVKCVVTESGGAQTVDVFVGTAASKLTTTTVDDVWSGGQVGLYRGTSSTTTTLQWDNFKCGIDDNADGDIDDSGTDYVYASYDFNDPGGDTWQ